MVDQAGIVICTKDIEPAEVTDNEAYVEVSNYFDGYTDTIPVAVRDYICAQWLKEQQWEPHERGYKRNMIREAVRYVAWCKAGLIDDKTHMATVRDCFGLDSTELVKTWVKRYPAPTPPPTPSNIYIDNVRIGVQFAGMLYKRE